MTSFIQSKHLAVVAACICATILIGPATAQQPDSAMINGTIRSPVYGNHTWTLTLQGLSYSYHNAPSNYDVGFLTRVYAASFDFEFQGPRATELNANVSDPLVNGGLPYGPCVELINYTLWESGSDWYGVSDWTIQVLPSDYRQGLSFFSKSYWGYEWFQFATGANGYPILAPFTSVEAYIHVSDHRPGFGYFMGSYGETVSVSSVGLSSPGDYNRDGVVDAADYVVWRKSPSTFGGNPGGYNTWRANFGQSNGSGATIDSTSHDAVPEPSGLMLLAIAAAAFPLRRKGRI